MIIVVMMSVVVLPGLDCHSTNVIILKVILLIVILLNVINLPADRHSAECHHT